MTTFQKDKGVMSLAVVLVVGLFGLGTAITIATVALTGLNKNFDNKSGSQSFYTAESAARESTYQYIVNDLALNGDVYAQNINSSTDNVIVDESDPIFTYITANATDTLTNRQVIYKLEKIPGSMTFSYTIFSTGDLTVSGGAGLTINCVDGVINCDDFPLGASVFSNENIDLNGAPNIDGGVYAAGTINPPGNPSGIVDGMKDIGDGIESISVPTIDLQPYRDEAIAGSTLFPTAADANTYLDSYDTGTVFIEDTGTTIIRDETLDGTLVTLDELDLRGGTYGTTDFSRAALIVEKDLHIRNSGHTGVTLNGIIYVKGTTYFHGDGVINGMLISVGGAETIIGGSVTMNYNPDISEEFKNIPGLDTTPIIVNWQEE